VGCRGLASVPLMLTGSPLLATVVLVVGLVLLVVGSDQLVAGAARLSSRLGMSPVVVGVVIIGFGTSTPELLVSLLAAVEGAFDLGVGNIIGSNIANVLLVLGVAAIAGPVIVGRATVRREVPLSLAGVVAFAWAVQGELRRIDAVLLALLLVAALGVLLARGRSAADADGELEGELDGDDAARMRVGRELLRALGGLVATLAGAQAVVLGGSAIALAAGLSEAFIGLTIVAVGTSLPELAAAVQSVRRRATDLLVGNILGSNLFNALAVGPVVVWTGASLGRIVSPDLAGRATLLMLAAVVAVSVLLARRRIDRIAGIVLVLAYAASVAIMAG
jgi:cation:H+ antiporter